MENVDSKRKYLQTIKQKTNLLDSKDFFTHNKIQSGEKRKINTDLSNINERYKLNSINHEQFKEKDNYYRNGQLWSMSCKHLHTPSRFESIDLTDLYNNRRKQKSGIKASFVDNEFGNEFKYNCERNETCEISHGELPRESANISHIDDKYDRGSNKRANSIVITHKGDSLLNAKYMKSFDNMNTLADINGLTGSHPDNIVYYVKSGNRPISPRNQSKTARNKKSMKNDQKVCSRPKSGRQCAHNKPTGAVDRLYVNDESQKLLSSRFYNNTPKDTCGLGDKNQKIIVKPRSNCRPVLSKLERAQNPPDKCKIVNSNSRFRDRSQMYEKNTLKNIRPIPSKVSPVKRCEIKDSYISNDEQKMYANQRLSDTPPSDYNAQMNSILEEQCLSDDNYKEPYQSRFSSFQSKINNAQKVGGLNISNVLRGAIGGGGQAELNDNTCMMNKSDNSNFKLIQSKNFVGDDQKVICSKQPSLFIRQSSPINSYCSTSTQQRIKTIRNRQSSKSPFFDKRDSDICKPSLSLKNSVRKLVGMSAPGIIESNPPRENKSVDRCTSYCQTTPMTPRNYLCDNFSQTQKTVNSVETCTGQDFITQETESSVLLQALKSCMQKLAKSSTPDSLRSFGAGTDDSITGQFSPIPPVAKFVDSGNQSTMNEVYKRNISTFSECHDFSKQEEERCSTKGTLTDNINQTVDLTPFLAELLNSCLNNPRLNEDNPCRVREKKTYYQPTAKRRSIKNQDCNRISKDDNSCKSCKSLMEQLMQLVKHQKQCNCQQIKTTFSCKQPSLSHYCNKGVNTGGNNSGNSCGNRAEFQCRSGTFLSGQMDNQNTMPYVLAATQTSMDDERLCKINSSMNVPNMSRNALNSDLRDNPRVDQRDECFNKFDRKYRSIGRQLNNVFGEPKWREEVARRVGDCCIPKVAKMEDGRSPRSVSMMRNGGQMIEEVEMYDGGQKLYVPMYSRGEQYDITCNPVQSILHRNQFHCYSCGNSISQESLTLDVDEEISNKKKSSLKYSTHQKYDSDSNSLSGNSDERLFYSSPDYSEGNLCSSMGCNCTSTISSPSD